MKSCFSSCVPLLAAVAALAAGSTAAFVPSMLASSSRRQAVVRLRSSRQNEQNPEEGIKDDIEIQWGLFHKHHARGSWKGIWTTYDYIGDVLDETVASVNLVPDNKEQPQVVQHSHSIVQGAKRSDCKTCFDSMDVKTFPVANYAANDPNLFQTTKTRLAANAMVNGPSLLRSGVMATELILARGDGRVRVIFQHAPVWEAGVEPGSVPPQGLKLVRTIVSREALRDTAPTAESETEKPPTPGNPIFYRPVPPFNWHKKWGGTSWTWGPSTGNRGWAIESMEEEDAWQGIATVERWNLRLPGGIFMQAPRIITGVQAELCRLAWLPDDETLLRVEAGVQALQPMVMDDDQLVGFYPPSLASLRCDVLQKLGELDTVPGFVKGEMGDQELVKPQSEAPTQQQTPPAEQVQASIENQQAKQTSSAEEQPQKAESSPTPQKPSSKDEGADDEKSGLDAIRDALQL